MIHLTLARIQMIFITAVQIVQLQIRVKTVTLKHQQQQQKIPN